jgi:hypothetical protein
MAFSRVVIIAVCGVDVICVPWHRVVIKRPHVTASHVFASHVFDDETASPSSNTPDAVV